MKRPILYILIPFILGIAVSSSVKIPLAYPIFGFALSAILSIVFLKNRIISHLALYLAVFFLGAACYQNALILPRDHISNFTPDEPKKIFLKGVITDDPLTVDTPYNLKKTSFTFSAATLNQSADEQAGWQGASGLVKVDLYSKSTPSYDFGDELILEGLISRPVALRNPGLFDYSKYLEIKNIYSVFKVKENFFVEKLSDKPRNPIKAIAYKLRRGLREAIDSHFDGYYNSFLKAIFIGDRTGLGDDIKDDFIKTGTVHILAGQYTKMPPPAL